MKLATILPSPHLDLGEEDDFHMALADVAARDPFYLSRFRDYATRGGTFVLLDNGAAENGRSIGLRQLARVAGAMQPHEVVLPDAVGDREETLRLGREALASGLLDQYRLMAVPQGSTAEEWLRCLREMHTWPVEAVGISRFVVNNGLFRSRAEALDLADQEHLLDGLDVHLLGCPADPIEIYEIAQRTRVPRSVDSGIAAIYAQAGLELREGVPKPDRILDFHGAIEDTDLLYRNIRAWTHRAVNGSWPES